MIRKEILDLLDKVEKPGRYIGGEYNMCVKDPSSVLMRFAFCYPDTYEIGMSNLGVKILYEILNDRDDTYCERAYAPWFDMEALMREHNIPLWTLETGDPVSDFDMVGFSLSYELSYSNVLNMLSLAGIPLLSSERKEGDPIIVAGGTCACHPEPLAPFIDLFMLGDGEDVICELMDTLSAWKKKGGTRDEFLAAAAGLEGVYIPAFYDVSYTEDGHIASITPNRPEAPEKITRRFVPSLEAVPPLHSPLVPNIDIVHDRITMEIFRGCTRGCRFCQAGILYRPLRERTPETIKKYARLQLKATGYEEVSLSSLSSGDYSCIYELVRDMSAELSPDHVNISLPSLRIDSFLGEVAEAVGSVRKSGLTFAPEAGTQRLRDIINKNVTEEDLYSSVRDAFEHGWSNVKLYFMIGLPGETDEDIMGIAELARGVRRVYDSCKKPAGTKRLNITISTSTFVPKPFTPFQWCGQISRAEMERRQAILQKELRQKNISYNWHDNDISILEAVFARGDRRLAAALIRAHELGCRMDGWMEGLDIPKWMQAFEETGIDPDFYARRDMEPGALLPWSHIDSGVDEEYLISEYNRAFEGKTTPDCRQGCNGCGLQGKGCPLCG